MSVITVPGPPASGPAAEPVPGLVPEGLPLTEFPELPVPVPVLPGLEGPLVLPVFPEPLFPEDPPGAWELPVSDEGPPVFPGVRDPGPSSLMMPDGALSVCPGLVLWPGCDGVFVEFPLPELPVPPDGETGDPGCGDEELPPGVVPPGLVESGS